MFKIYLYHMSAENNRMDKTNYLTQIAELNGELREATSVINPSITFQITSDMQDLENGVLDCNYIYIPNFKRYYFVDNIVCVTNTLWQIDCSVDVLMSFKTQLGELDVFCERNEFNYNDMLIDDKVPSNNNMNINIFKSLTTPFNTMDRNTSSTFVIISVAGYKEKPIVNSGELRVPHIQYYIFPILTFNNFCEMLFNPFASIAERFFIEPSECLRSVTVYPFNPILYIGELLSTETSIKMGSRDFNLEYSVQRIENKRILTISGGSVTVSGLYNNFLDYEPYTTSQLFIPFIGYVDIATDLIMNKTLNLSYKVDIETGESLVEVTDNDGNIVFTTKTQLGYVIPTVKTNSSQQLMSIFGAITSFITSSITSGGNIASGLLSGGASLAKNFQGYAHSPKKQSDLNAFRKTRESIKSDVELGIIDESVNFISKNTINAINACKQKIISSDGGNNVSLLSTIELKFSVRTVTPNAYYPNGYNHLLGKPSKYTGKLKELKGYTELSGFHLEGLLNCTSTEQQAINDILRSGFLMPEPPTP